MLMATKKTNDYDLDYRTEVYGRIHTVGEMDRPAFMTRFGKRAAGRLLNGRTWNEVPK